MSFDTTPDASDVLARLKEIAKASKAYLIQQNSAMSQASCDAAVPLAVIQHLGAVQALLNAQLALVPAATLTSYARSVTGNASYDPVAEFNSMMSAYANAQSTLTGMFPKDGSGFILWQTIQANGTLANRTFTSAQLANAVTVVNSVIAAIGG